MTRKRMFKTILIYSVLALLYGYSLAAAESARPNVLFLIVDDLTTTLSCQQWPGAKTPNLDKLAARGVRFDRAYCQFALCNPARASFLTGCYPQKTKVTDLSTSFRTALPDVVTLPQHFKNHGYKTAAIGKVFHVPDPKTEHDIVHRSPLLLDQKILEEAKKNDPTDPPRGKGGGHDYNRTYAAAKRPDSDFTDHQIAERAIATITQLKDGPFFISLGFIRPHTPYVAPQWAFDAIDRSQIKLPPFFSGPGEDTSKLPKSALRPNNNVFRYEPPTREQALDAIHAYLAAVHFVDHQIGRVLAELDRLGLTEKTFICLTGDHGYQLGEHGLWAKQTLFDEANHVPLIFAGPGIQPGVSKALVEQVDIYPTLATLAGLSLPAHLQGTSLAPWLHDPAGKSRIAVFSTMIATHTKALGHSARNSRYRYIEWNGGKDGVQLYDLQTDPRQLTNLAGQEAHLPMQHRLKRLLAEHLARVSK
jgi:arylsulfatase A-like enzyme